MQRPTTSGGGTQIHGRSGDTSSVATRLTSNQFVGRTAQLEELELALRRAADRQPALVLLGGDSGVGKTRLVAELQRRLSEGSVTVLRGEAVEQGGAELPFAPLTGAFRPLVRAHHPAFEALGPGSRAQLAALLPGLERTGEDPSGRHDPSAQLRLFEALLELIDLVSEDQPLVLILEDVHWADRSTRTFAAFLARSLRRERVMTVLTYRTDELHRRHPLRPLLSELERLECVRRIELSPFDRTELAEILADILDGEPDEELVERLFTRSEGNALYTEELLAAGLDGRGAAPQSLRDAFLLRIERLSDEAQQAARAIAAGRRLDEAMIGAITGIDPQPLQVALREAVAEQVLVAGGDDRLMFRHALLREALYDDLLPGERGDLHLALARALEARCANDDEQEAELAAAIAGHYAAAGDQPAALRATVRAALAARDVHAYGEAADLAERALELWPRVPETDRTIPLGHVDLLELAAAAHGIAGDRLRAETLLETAIDDVDPERDQRRHARLLWRLARIQWSLNRGLQGVETAQRALSLLPQDEPSVERASLMAWLARTRYLRGRFRDSIADGEAALDAAVAASDPHTEAEVLNTLGMAKISIGSVDEGVGLLRRAIEIARDTTDPDNFGYAYSNLAEMLGIAGRTREAVEVAKEGLTAVPRRMPRLHDWMMMTVAQLSFEAGDWDDAREHLGPQSPPLDRTPIFRLLLEAEVALGEGADDLAAQRLDEAEMFVAGSTEPQWIGWFGALRGEQLRRRYDLIGARAAVENALDRLELCTDDVMRIARASAAGARVEGDIAERARDLRERGDERDAIARARIHDQRLDAAAQEGGPVERAWRAVGRAELARADGRNEPELWLEAVSAWRAIDRPYHEAFAQWQAAEAQVQAGDRAAAAAAAGPALQTARRLGSSWLADEIVALAHRARLELTEDAAAEEGASGGVAQATPEEDPFGLTPRERQVLALIAEGATNRQIGASLFMAEKTASVHVSRILGKLGVRSRTQAAAVAHRRHLT
jgi:DNA-binding CsgD family transcriptional regulator/tetratricopeptide (TPR) repeat protein